MRLEKQIYPTLLLKFYNTNLNESHQYASQILYGYGRSIELFMIMYRQGKITGTVYTGAIHSLLLSIITASKQHHAGTRTRTFYAGVPHLVACSGIMG